MNKLYLIFKNGNEVLLDKEFTTNQDAKTYGDHLLTQGNVSNYFIY